ncbi:MAG: hypothetical protein ACT4PV_16165 [Planctomycetaceae bacterium]
MRWTLLALCACALSARASDCDDPWWVDPCEPRWVEPCDEFEPPPPVIVRRPPVVEEEVAEDGTRVVTVRRGDYLAGSEGGCPPASIVHEMIGPAHEIHLHLSWRSGLYRISASGDLRRATGGVEIEWCDAATPPHPRRNPWRPAPFQPEDNPGWRDFVEGLGDFPNGEPGFWYTQDSSPCRVDRTLIYRFDRPGRYRVRVSGVLPDTHRDWRAPTLLALSELTFPPRREPPAPPPPPRTDPAPAPPPAPSPAHPEEPVDAGGRVDVFLDPRTPFVFEMQNVADAIELGMVFTAGLYARSGHGERRGSTGGVLIEFCDAARPADPTLNPWQRASLQVRANPAWRNSVRGLGPYPNGVPGFWYTTAETERPLERRIVYRFPVEGRYRVRITGVIPNDDRHFRVPTLVEIVERGISPARDAAE